MRLYLISLLLLISVNTFAQISTKLLKGSWVKARIEFKNGDEITNDIPTKYGYVRYNFLNSDEITVQADYTFRGIKLNYSIDGDLLNFKNSTGFVVNTFFVEKATSQVLVLLQIGPNGFNDPHCLRYIFYRKQFFDSRSP
jgi:hypothetical protein